MEPTANTPWWTPYRWTLGLGAIIVYLNLGLFPPLDTNGKQFLTWLQYDGTAINHGQLWRILTGNLIHWDRSHFYLDFLAFLGLGVLYERYFPRSYPWLLLWIAVAVGMVQWLTWPERMQCRGLSGINAGQFAVALCVEVTRARHSPRRWIWVGPAIVFFFVWIAYGAITGRHFLLPGEGEVAGVAHLTGAMAGIVFYLLLSRGLESRGKLPERGT